MLNIKRKCLGFAAALLGAMLLAAPAAHAAYPAKPIKLLIPWGAGGGMDTMARIMEAKVTEYLGQPLNYVYKPGAGSAIGTAEIAKARADGYNVLFNLYPQLEINVRLGVASYSPDDLVPVCMVATDYPCIASLKDGKFKTFEDLVAAAKAKPGTITMGTTDRSGPVNGAALILKNAGVPVNVIPFAAGGTKAVSALLGNQVDCLFSTMLPVLNMLGDKGNILAYAAPERHPDLPAVRTTTEVGYPEAQGFSGRFFFVPKGTPEPVIAKLCEAFKYALADPDVHKRLSALGVIVQFLDYKDSVKMIESLKPQLDKVVNAITSDKK